MNRHASEAADPAAPASITASTIGVFVPPAFEPVTVKAFNRTAAEPPVWPAEIPTLLFSIDVKEVTGAMAEWARRRRDGPPPSEAEVSRLFERHGRAAQTGCQSRRTA